jgi:glycosyltransferase involved in cell wall biosynthesis
MNVLVVHNRYRETGGEDRVVELESALLRRKGHKVVPYVLDNADIEGMNPIALAGRTIWNHRAYYDVGSLISHERIDLVHVHNTLPLVSPSAYYAGSAAQIPVVQTLHNYRLLCPAGVLARDGKACVSCVGASPLPAIRHACYRGSRAATGAVAAMLMVHRALGTGHRTITTYIAPTAFVRGMFIAGGLPAGRIRVKPHFVDPDPGTGTGRGGYALYVGRLTREKGVHTLLEAWAGLNRRIPLKIAGTGPLAQWVAAAAAQLEGVTYLGPRNRSEVQALMADASVLVFPSIVYETFGQVIIEAFAAGTPVVATGGGAAAELVTPGHTGALVRSGDAAHLAGVVEGLFSDAVSLASMRTAARAAYEARFTADANYQQLMTIYRDARTLAPSPPRTTAPAPAHHSVADAIRATDEARP